ncbi:HTTM domain-containing protein [Xanthocytophaga flava]|uniref:HTTM domain-containing protein n=1 Tax=Xanthocytophaga flava TaxID=3048013 RepID=UPI0028D0FB31|nr:HTTM domain-containing protein [Xanthocytophaga flavus]MDJ1471925.1 HTTM domain-containing protein [Xanthocytophaga flavus]
MTHVFVFCRKMELLEDRTNQITLRKTWIGALTEACFKPVSPAPLITFRIVFGALLAFSTIRFIWMGWIDTHYSQPVFHFTYYGFRWIPVFSAPVLYVVHVLMVISAIGVMLGFCYRLSAVMLFLTFVYTELIDLTYYLNHYYFVSLVCFLLIWLPANHYFSIDHWLSNRKAKLSGMPLIPVWTIGILRFQLVIVYLYAGLAKINYDWLIDAMPLKLWLPVNDTLPLIGPVFTWKITAYAFSWIGMLYDCAIPFLLLNKRTRVVGYGFVIVFHIFTWILFPIGVFPWVMIGATLIFFSANWHQKFLSIASTVTLPTYTLGFVTDRKRYVTLVSVVLFCLFQIVFPWRYLLYPGNLFWTEEGFRFSWRVMLMEKSGVATFYVKDIQTGREIEVQNRNYLNEFQERQMSAQPDFILQFAHFLASQYEQKGFKQPQVRAEVYVTLNGKPSRLLIDPHTDLTKIQDGWEAKSWILPDQ